MHNLHFSIAINAPKEHVWNTMLADETFRQWSGEITEGSHYEGDWEQGSEIRFFGLNGDGVLSRVRENKPYNFISIENYGVIENRAEDTQGPAAVMAAAMSESYTFAEESGVTAVSVDTSADDEYKPIFERAWPKALSKLKTLCEN